jgi:sugar/nucleoside kinase (ribokinase family)
LVRAARAIQAMGPQTLVIKHGEYGASLYQKVDGKELFFKVPGLPLDEVVDPTGAGDSFAGGFFGYLASQKNATPAAFYKAMFYGSVMGSLAVERFGTERIANLDAAEIEARFKIFRELTHLG